MLCFSRANSVSAQCEVTQIKKRTAVWTNCSLVQHEPCCLPPTMWILPDFICTEREDTYFWVFLLVCSSCIYMQQIMSFVGIFFWEKTKTALDFTMLNLSFKPHCDLCVAVWLEGEGWSWPHQANPGPWMYKELSLKWHGFAHDNRADLRRAEDLNECLCVHARVRLCKV